MKKVVVYTDGGCRGNSDNLGSWAFTARYEEHINENYGIALRTTNNRMELAAVSSALEMLTEKCEVDIHCDSMYVINGVTKWHRQWVSNNWVTNKGRCIKNKSEWIRLLAAVGKHKCTFIHVRAHTGVESNERADELCNIAMDNYVMI